MRLRRRSDDAGAAAEAEPPWALLSFLLRYPDARVVGARDEIRAAVEAVELPACRAALQRFLAAWTGDEQELAAHYVEVFDLRRRASLELTYYAHGDTRERGMALLRLKKLYRAAGLPLDCPELPDHLTVMLAFAELAPPGHGRALLTQHRAELELLKLSLHDLGTPYAHLLDAVVSGLPGLGVAERAEVARLAREGPPEEAVGLEPYGPPEAMPEGARA